ncbi:MAG: hypothetical protein ABI592_16920 [Acidobacteriota bacterium]
MLRKKDVAVREERPARKQPLSDADAKALLRSVSEVIVARGKSSRRLAAKDATIEDLRGNRGAFRAPIIRKGRTLLVGFSEAELDKLLG